MIDSFHHVLGSDRVTAEEAAIQTANGVLAALNTVELDVNLTIIVVEYEADVLDMTVLVFAFLLHVIFKVLLPVRFSFPATTSAFIKART